MRHAATALFLSGWIGFLAVSAATPALAILRIAEPGFPVPSMLADQVERCSRAILAAGGNGELLVATLASLLAMMAAVALAISLWIVLRLDGDDRRFGERLALGGLGAAGVLLAATSIAGSPALEAAGSLPTVLGILALSALAILFDRVLEHGEEEDADDDGFRAALSLIGQEMARDALRQTPRVDRDGHR